MPFRIGIDLGGTKIEIAALDRSGCVVMRRRVATPRGDYAATLDAIVALVADTERAIGAPATVGIASPGALSPASGVLRNSNSVCLNGRPFHRDIEQMLGRQVRLENDANCFALSEAVDGAGQGAKLVFGVILGTGVGGGIAIDGRILHGANAIAGEWGHNPLPWPRDDERPGRVCYCGRRGCIETFLSGPAMAADHALATGEQRDGEGIVAGAMVGDTGCAASLARYEDRLARSLATVINLIDPDVIVLGGGLSNVARWYETVPKLWGRYVFSDTVRTRLARHAHGDSSGVRGAAWLW